ncbi:SAM-dependent methyltransferase [Pelomyxa schiedti]|nr:SAM-dependent methyltransferase [Pelomyxa schiedti]
MAAVMWMLSRVGDSIIYVIVLLTLFYITNSVLLALVGEITFLLTIWKWLHRRPDVDGPVSGIRYRLMALGFWIRDKLEPPQKKLSWMGRYAPVHHAIVIDFGCGSGSYTQAAANLVGSSGRVIAIDVHPLAIADVEKRRLPNVVTVLSNDVIEHQLHLKKGTVDVVLLFDVLHALAHPSTQLLHIHDLLKPAKREGERSGVLAVYNEHMGKKATMALIRQNGFEPEATTSDNVHIFRLR